MAASNSSDYSLNNVNYRSQEYNSKPQNLLKWLAVSYCAPFRSLNTFLNLVCSFFPVLIWLPKYSWNNNFLCDLISGLTIGVMFVPQGKCCFILSIGVYWCYFSFKVFDFVG